MLKNKEIKNFMKKIKFNYYKNKNNIDYKIKIK